jgi:hypothetical protein
MSFQIFRNKISTFYVHGPVHRNSNALIWPRWKQVVAHILRPAPEAAVTVLCTPDDGCDGHSKHVE